MNIRCTHNRVWEPEITYLPYFGFPQVRLLVLDTVHIWYELEEPPERHNHDVVEAEIVPVPKCIVVPCRHVPVMKVQVNHGTRPEHLGSSEFGATGILFFNFLRSNEFHSFGFY